MRVYFFEFMVELDIPNGSINNISTFIDFFVWPMRHFLSLMEWKGQHKTVLNHSTLTSFDNMLPNMKKRPGNTKKFSK